MPLELTALIKSDTLSQVPPGRNQLNGVFSRTGSLKLTSNRGRLQNFAEKF